MLIIIYYIIQKGNWGFRRNKHEIDDEVSEGIVLRNALQFSPRKCQNFLIDPEKANPKK